MWRSEEQPQPHELAETPPGARIHRSGDHFDGIRLRDDHARQRDAGGEDAAEADDRETATARCERAGERRDEDRHGQRDRPGRVPEACLRDAQSRDCEGAQAEDVGPLRPPPVESGEGEDRGQEGRGQHTERA